MSTTTVTAKRSSAPTHVGRPHLVRRFFGVVAHGSTYRNLAFLLVGLPLGTLWFSVLVTGVSVSVSMLIVALLGIPMLLGMWYVVRACANVERHATNVLLDRNVPYSPMASGQRGNVWVRLRELSRDPHRWREAAYLMLRFPAGIATFTVAVTALWTPVVVALAPILARTSDEPFGDWSLSERFEDVAGSPWAWFLIPGGIVMLVAALHFLNALASACGRWATAWLDPVPDAHSR